MKKLIAGIPAKEYIKQYREKNKNKIIETQKRYYKEHKNKIAEIQKRYNKKNKDKITKKLRNRETILKSMRKNKQEMLKQLSPEILLKHVGYYKENTNERTGWL